MKTIHVVAAIICEGNKILATQRADGVFRGKWEFPGGKVEKGETKEEALKREIDEELNTKIHVGKLIKTIEYDYSDFHLKMDCFLCQVESGNLELREHLCAKWLTKGTIDSVDWLEADLELVEVIKEFL